MSTYKMACPHCQARIRIRSSEGLHELMRTAYIQCQNEACGFTATAIFEITAELSPSAMPNASIKLPSADSAARRRAMQKKKEAA